MKISELREKRARLIEQARAIVPTDSARSMDAEQTAQFDLLMAEAEQLKTVIGRLETLETEERSLAESRGRRTPSHTSAAAGPDALRSWLLGNSGTMMTVSLASAPMQVREDVRSWQERAMTTGAPAAGGYTIAPEFHSQLEKALLTFGGAREASKVLRTSTGAPLSLATMNDTGNEGRQLSENTLVPQTDLAVGTKTFGAFKFTSDIVMVSSELLQDSAFALASEIGTALGERIGRVTNRLFTVGSGVEEPEGILTNAPVGVTGASATGITYDELVDLEHSVGRAYRKGAKWVFADSTLRELKKLRDNDGKLIWQAGLAGVAPDTILGYEYIVNDDMPAMAAGAKSILFGQTSKHIIRDVKDIELKRLNERYAELDMVAFLAFSRHDAKLIDAGTNPVKVFRNAA